MNELKLSGVIGLVVLLVLAACTLMCLRLQS
jgi:hypothetical protein